MQAKLSKWNNLLLPTTDYIVISKSKSVLHWAIPEKSKHGGLRIYVFENPLEFFIFLLYPWKFQTKQSSAHGYSTKLC